MAEMNVKVVPVKRDADGNLVFPEREPASRWITLKVPVYTTGHYSMDADGETVTSAEFTPDQWTYIEKCALEHIKAMLEEQAEGLITPEVDFYPDGMLFPDYGDGSNEAEEENIGQFRLEAAGTVVDIVDNLLSEIDEEIGKRDI